MNWFTNILSGGIDKVISSVGDALDKNITSDDERNKAKIIMQSQLQSFKVEMESKSNEFEKEVTKRWQSDSEHLITRLVRPVSFSVMLVLFIVIVIADGNLGEFKVAAAYIPVIQNLLITMTIAYFGSRGAEKVAKEVRSLK